MKIPKVGAETDRHDEGNCRFSFAKVPKIIDAHALKNNQLLGNKNLPKS